MSDGRGTASDTTFTTGLLASGPTHAQGAGPFTRRPVDQRVYRIGIATLLIGVALAVIAWITRSGIGRFGLVPEIVVGFEAFALGGIAIHLARPPRQRRFGGSILVLGAAAVSSVATVLVSFDALGILFTQESAAARLVVGLGTVVLLFLGLVTFAVVVQAAFIAAWRRFLAAGGARWLR